MIVYPIPDINSELWNTDTVLAGLCHFMLRDSVIYIGHLTIQNLHFLSLLLPKKLRLNSDYFLPPNVCRSMDPIHKELLKEPFCILRLSNSKHYIPWTHLPQIRIRTKGIPSLGLLVCYHVSEMISECTDSLPEF